MVESYWDVAESKRADLTEDQVRAYVKTDAMLSGVQVPCPPLPPPKRPAFAIGTENVFAVQKPSAYSPDTLAVFATREQAECFAALMPMKLEYDYRTGADYKYAAPIMTLAVVEMSVFKREYLQQAREQLAAFAADVESHKKQCEAYALAQSACDTSSDSIWTDWRKCLYARHERKHLVGVFNDYVASANGDRIVAMNFLKKAYGEDQIASAFEECGEAIPT